MRAFPDSMLEMKRRDGLGRICTLETPHGEVETPALAPVINPNRLTITPSEMKERFGVSLIITNAYIIWKSQTLKSQALENGLHSLLDFNGPIMTDSGTFQSHVYGEVDVSNLEIVQFQMDIGSDFSTILDVFSAPDESRERAESAVRETQIRAAEARAKGSLSHLVGPIQGSTYPDLREKCAQEVSAMDFSVHAIGGVVPLMESYRFSDLVDAVIHSRMKLDPSKPVHLFGAGHPMMFPLAVAMGCDLFDSSSYAKFAADGRMMFPDGTRRIKDLDYRICDCPACSQWKLEEMKESPSKIAEHNLHVCQNEMRRVKQAVSEGSLFELVEKRASAHPFMGAAVERLYSHYDFLEKFENISREGGFFVNDVTSLDRPAAKRFRDRVLKRYTLNGSDAIVMLSEAERPFFTHYSEVIKRIRERTDASVLVNSVLGPVPLGLDEAYPVGQTVVSENLTLRIDEKLASWLERFLVFHEAPPLYSVDGEESLGLLPESSGGPFMVDWDLERIRRVADYQFGLGAGEALTEGKVDIVKSKRTGKIRNVILNGDHILSMRAHDGLFTLKIEGARKLSSVFDPPHLRIEVEDDATEFIRGGKNVFAKFVTACDGGLRPGDEALVVDKEGTLLAVARAVMNREEMLAFSKGLAARVREGFAQ